MGVEVDYIAAMRRAITLAEMGFGKTSPNPIVGAVIIDAEGLIIGEGFHNRMAAPDHAEVVAINSAKNKSNGATMVVSLEPCNHVGITGPCVQAIIDAGISTLVYAVTDPNEEASGGADTLRAAGINVIKGVLEREATDANRAWLTRISRGRPYFTWKIATTLDARVAASDGSSNWITNEASRADVQILRRQADAILVGTNTVITDNPHLIPRGDFVGYTHNPIRVICGEQELPGEAKVFDDLAQTVVIKTKDLDLLIERLSELDVNHVVVEAGPTLGSAMVDHGLIDELIIYRAPSLLGSGKHFYLSNNASSIDEKLNLEHISTEILMSDIKSVYRLRSDV